jgi:putative endonuclease
MAYFVYILECKDKTLYTGITNDLEKRFLAHKNGTGAKYTRSHPPKKIVYSQNFRTKGKALKKEIQIKQLSRLKKLELIKLFSENANS